MSKKGGIYLQLCGGAGLPNNAGGSELGMKSALLCPYRSTMPPRERFYALPFLSF
jgi:hypothetical protein